MSMKRHCDNCDVVIESDKPHYDCLVERMTDVVEHKRKTVCDKCKGKVTIKSFADEMDKDKIERDSKQ